MLSSVHRQPHQSLAGLFLLVITGLAMAEPPPPKLRVGCKSFTENVILAEMVRQLAEDAGVRADLTELGGTQVVWRALLANEIDIYPEYTGTLVKEILANEKLATMEQIVQSLAAEV